MNLLFKIMQIGLWLTIFLFSLLGSGQNLFSQTKDTLWTRDVWPLYVINGVFSPDDQFIYATGASDSYGKGPFTVLKYDLQGNLLTKIDSIGGIRQFSEDGRFFWNFIGDKYEAVTFQKLFPFANGKFNTTGWQWSINEKTEIGILAGEGKITQTQFQNFFDSNLVVFELNTMKVQKVTSHPDKAYWLSHPTINSEGTNLAIIAGLEKRNDKDGYYTDSVHIELWSLLDLKKVAEIQLEKTKGSLPVILKYSPDGSVLGYQHDGKLTLYSTTDYSVVWENNDRTLNFCWSPSMESLYLSEFTTKKFNYSTKKLIYEYKIPVDPAFYSFNKSAFKLLTTTENWRLILLDNTVTSVDDFYVNNDFKINCFTNYNCEVLYLQITTNSDFHFKYYIVDTLGLMLVKPKDNILLEGENEFNVNISNLANGVYFLKLQIEGHNYELKFVISR